MSFKYKNVSGVVQSLDGHGLVEAGEEFSTDIEVNNTNFELLGSTNEEARIPVEQPQTQQQPVQSTADPHNQLEETN